LAGPPPQNEVLRDRWLAATDLEEQKRIAAQLQAQAFADVPFLPLGQFFQPTTRSKTLEGGPAGHAHVLKHPAPNVRGDGPPRSTACRHG
jgi:hypothetical protein